MITVVSLAWNKAEMTREFLQRLKAHTDIEHELVFTDNGSTEPVASVVKAIYPQATLISNGRNIGCPATRNPSMQKTKGEIVFWLDNDTFVNEGWYRPFLEVLEKHPKVGICGAFGKRVRKLWELPFPFEEPTPYGRLCDGFMGYAMAMRKEAYQPIPDWGLAVNMDDIDVAVEMKAKGWQARMIDYPPMLVHLGSQTTRGWESDNQEVLGKWWERWKDRAPEVLENYKV